jgi:glutaredoxin 2
LNNLNKVNLTDNYLGFARVKNSTLPEILKMAKEDCYQFQKTFYQGDDNKLYWTYTKKIEKRVKTKEEIEEEKKREIERQKKIESGEIKVDTRSLEEILEEIKNED